MNAKKIAGLVTPEIALMIAALGVGLYLVKRVADGAGNVAGSVADTVKEGAKAASSSAQAAVTVANAAGSLTPVGLATDAARKIVAPTVRSLSTGGISGAFGDALDWIRGTSYDPNAPTPRAGSLQLRR